MSVSTIMGVPVANIAKINGIPIASISKWNGETIDSSNSPFITEWVIPSDSLSLTLPLNNSNGSTFNCTVDWGDSTSSTITAYDDTDRIHTYSSAGTYQVRITGTCEGWSFNYGGDRLKLTKIISFGKGLAFSGFKYLKGGFYGCENLLSTGADYIKPSGAGVLTFEACFTACALLSTIQKDIFRYNTSATNFYSCFSNCSSLSILPIDLFRYNTVVSNFTYCFYACNKLQISADIFYQPGEAGTRFLNESVDFTYCFNRTAFSGTQGIAPDLWNCDFGTGTPTKTGCFGGAGNSATSLSNYASIPADWK